uniref:Uncharacterized protein n=1 Tax=Anopheles stephensi TaxID=30069 RepID=A0A182Y600_ANOST
MYGHGNGGGGITNLNDDDVEEAIHQSFARPKRQTHLKPAADRISCDSGISLEDPALITPINPPAPGPSSEGW